MKKDSSKDMLVWLKILFHPVYFAIILFSFTVISNGCSNNERKRIDLSGIDVEIEIKRLEEDLYNLEFDRIDEGVEYLKEKYGEFFDIYNHLIIKIGSHESPAYNGYLMNFLTDYDIHQLQMEVKEVFPGLGELEAGLSESFRRYKYFFPGNPVPAVYTYIAGFNQSIATADSILAIGLDKYLGEGHTFYEQLHLPRYKQMNMHPGKILPDCMKAWAITEFEYVDSVDNLVANMIYNGRIMYFKKMMLPHEHDTLITGFTSPQLEWCRKNEDLMWTYLVENKLLFTTNKRDISRLVNEGPFTAEFTRESPARAVVWLGWQIAESYMKRNPGITLEQFMNDHDYQRILNDARYRP